MNYSHLRYLQQDDELLPIELPFVQALEVLLGRILVFAMVVLINLLLFFAFLEIAGIRLVLQPQ